MSGWRDMDKDVATIFSIVPALYTTTTTGTGIDLSGFTKALVLVQSGVVTDGTHTFKLQDSADNSTFADVAAGNLSGSFTALTSVNAAASFVEEIGYLGSKQYVRVVCTVTGSPSTGGTYGALVVRAGARSLPQ